MPPHVLIRKRICSKHETSLDLNKALLLFQKACKLGRLDSCVRINNIKFKLLKKLDEETYQSNLKYFLDQNSSFALLEHITTLSKQDIKSAIILAKKSCEQGMMLFVQDFLICMHADKG